MAEMFVLTIIGGIIACAAWDGLKAVGASCAESPGRFAPRYVFYEMPSTKSHVAVRLTAQLRSSRRTLSI